MPTIINGTDNTATTPAFTGTDTDTGVFFPAANQVALATNGTTAVTVDASQNVGIGTASPSFKLDVFGTTPALRIKANGVGNGVKLEQSSGTGDVQLNVIDGYALAFATSNTERMRVDSSGNLFVNSTFQTFGEKFKVVNSGAGNNAAFFWFDDATNDRGAVLVKNTRASGATSGSMMAFLNSSNSAVGAITSTGSATTYSTSSDYRLKENIAPMTGALAKVAQLKPVTYTWKETGENSQGFIAHELQSVVPDCVTGEKDAVDEEGNPKYQGIDTSFLVATLTAAIQELNAKVIELEAKVK